MIGVKIDVGPTLSSWLIKTVAKPKPTLTKSTFLSSFMGWVAFLGTSHKVNPTGGQTFPHFEAT